MRAKFRETLWFKKGEQDAKVADEAVAAGDLFAPQAVDMLPIEDRYEDDGSIAATDSVAFGVHTGKTEYMPKGLGAPRVDDGEDEVDEHKLVGDLKRGRIKVVAAIGGCAVVIAVALFAFL
jgi:hypothetical protein